MKCEICRKPATIHFHRVSKSGKKGKTEHYCMDHAHRGGLSNDRVERIRHGQKGMRDFIAFVETNRRVPSVDELREIGVLVPDDPDPADTIGRLVRFAEGILAEHGDTSSSVDTDG